MKSLNSVLAYEPVRQFFSKSSLAVALDECDPFITAVPCHVSRVIEWTNRHMEITDSGSP